jgi:carboxyl-terminal processing protease
MHTMNSVRLRARIGSAFLWTAIGLSFSIPARAESANARYGAVFGEIGDTIAKYFYDPRFVTEQFGGIRKRYGEQVAAARSQSQFAEVIDAMLAELKASHTHYYTPQDPAYYQLASIFAAHPNVRPLLQGKPPLYPSIGIETRRRGGKVFVQAVFEGRPADKAGIVKGDEIIAIDGQRFTPVASLRERVGRTARLSVRRRADSAPLTVDVVPAMVDPKEEFLAAERSSVRVFAAGGKKVGYIHLLSYASEDFHRVFLEALMGPLEGADALIWDLRDGWGGADPKYLNVFNKEVPVLSLTDREGKTHRYDPQWRKPVVMLTNGTVRSGKEVLAYAFKKYGIGKVIGERTAGAVLGGTPFVLSDGSILYLAVHGVRVDDVVLEGDGIEPDIAVPMDVEYLAGNDRQLQKAVEYFAETFKHRGADHPPPPAR